MGLFDTMYRHIVSAYIDDDYKFIDITIRSYPSLEDRKQEGQFRRAHLKFSEWLTNVRKKELIDTKNKLSNSTNINDKLKISEIDNELKKYKVLEDKCYSYGIQTLTDEEYYKDDEEFYKVFKEKEKELAKFGLYEKFLEKPAKFQIETYSFANKDNFITPDNFNIETVYKFLKIKCSERFPGILVKDC